MSSAFGRLSLNDHGMVRKSNRIFKPERRHLSEPLMVERLSLPISIPMAAPYFRNFVGMHRTDIG
jgi:hypothetical protein